MRIINWLGMMAGLLAPAAGAAELSLVVNSTGPNPSIQAALDAARAQRKPGDSVTILLDGVHRLASPLRLTELDSGTTIAAAPGSKAELSGGRVLTGWKRASGNSPLWELQIPEAKEGKWVFRQLFVDGKRRQRARTPNSGYYRIQGESPQDKPVKLKFRGGDIKKEWAEAGDVEVIAYLAWADLRMQIRSVDETENVATLSGDPRPSNREANAQYFVENAPDGLDAPGEWRLDSKTGWVRYWPLDGEDMEKAVVIAPALQELVLVQGNAATKTAATHITFRGLTFAHTDYELGPNGFADTQAAVAVPGDLRFEYATDCVVEDCRFTHLAGYGMEAGRGAQRIKVRHCEMFDLGGGGIRIGETAKRTDPFDECHSNEVSDSHLHRLGRIFAPAVGVFVLQSGTNLVSHNHIHDLYYTAVSLGWNWGYQESPCRENRVEFNHMHDIGKGLLSDMGAVYTLGIQRGTVIQNNLIHDVRAFTYGGWGLYTDEGSTGILLQNNVVYHCKSAGFHQHYGRDNVVRNNIFAFNQEHQLMRTREEGHNSFTFENNIVVFDSGDLLGSNWSNDKFTMDRNIYWDERADQREKMFAGKGLAEWRRRGHDANSAVADPEFDQLKSGSFRLKSTSPALALGFQAINLTEVGPRPKPAR